MFTFILKYNINNAFENLFSFLLWKKVEFLLPNYIEWENHRKIIGKSEYSPKRTENFNNYTHATIGIPNYTKSQYKTHLSSILEV